MEIETAMSVANVVAQSNVTMHDFMQVLIPAAFGALSAYFAIRKDLMNITAKQAAHDARIENVEQSNSAAHHRINDLQTHLMGK